MSLASLALFPLVHGTEDDRVLLGSRRSMQRVSTEIETAVVSGRVRARFFAGFQKLSYFLPRVRMFRRISAVADGVWVFGVPDVAPPAIPGVTYVHLVERDPLVREWFVVVDAAEYCSALVAEDQSGFAVPQAERAFRALWTVSSGLTSRLQRELGEVVGLPALPPLPIEARDSRSQLRHLARSAGRLVETLEAQNQRLLELQTTREALSRMLVHDLRSPLTGVMGALSLLADDEGTLPPETRRRVAANGVRSANALNAMITEVLDVAKLQAGRVVLRPTAAPAIGLVLDAVERARMVAEAQGKRIEALDSGPLPDVLVERDKIERVLDNLIGNALKYTDRGGRITLSARAIGGAVEVSVADDGQGIPAEALERIFEPFAQVGGAGQRAGTGLGLTSCRLFVEAHGGAIRVESDGVRGTTFHFSLPASPAS